MLISKIPRMEADLILESIHRRIFLDTKLHRDALRGRGTAGKLHSGFRVQACTVNLSADWRDIYDEMLEIVEVGRER